MTREEKIGAILLLVWCAFWLIFFGHLLGGLN
jgi:hypothetical protein